MTMIQGALTSEFRVSFPALFHAKKDMNGRLRYSIEMLFPKSADFLKGMAKLRVVHDAAIPKRWIAGGEDYRDFKSCFINGDKKKQAERKGHWILRASSGPDFPPRLLLPNRSPATDHDLYAGCYARAILTPYAYEAKNEKGVVINRGIAFNLHTVQKTRDGDPLSKTLNEAEADAMLAEAPLEDDELDALLDG